VTTTRRTAAPAAAARARPHHSLAPAHIGEAGSVGLLAISVGGIALFITGLAMIVSGITMGARYASDPPPNVGQLGLWPLLGGVGCLVLAVALIGSAVAVVVDVPRARPVAGAISALTGVLAAVGAGVVILGVAPDPVIASALVVAVVIFAGAAVLLLRPRR
jgi:hypothetical protein